MDAPRGTPRRAARSHDGKLATFDDKYTVQADQFNNPNASIQAGEGNILISFLPTPLLESLGIGIRPIIPL
jgi:hypothetical protein